MGNPLKKIISLSLLPCVGFSLWWLHMLQSNRLQTPQVHSWSMRAQKVGRESLRSCGAWAQLLQDRWTTPRPGMEPVFPEMAGRFPFTAQQGSSQFIFNSCFIVQNSESVANMILFLYYNFLCGSNIVSFGESSRMT